MKVINYIDDSGVHYEIPVPGFSASTLKISFKEGKFTVLGERVSGNGKTVTISHNLDLHCESKITATIQNGLLILTVVRGK